MGSLFKRIREVIKKMEKETELMTDEQMKNVLIVVIIGVLGICISNIITAAPREEYEIEEKTDIYSVGQLSDTQGIFVLGTGSLKEKQYYITYIYTDDGLKMEKYQIDETFLSLDLNGNEVPYVSEIYNVKKFTNEIVFKEKAKAILHLPENFIQKEISLN